VIELTKKPSNRKKNVLIAGSGQMACAMSSLLVRNGHNITILCREPEEAQQINLGEGIIFHSDTLNKTTSLPGVKAFTYKEIDTLSNDFEYILLAVPTEAIRDVLENIKPALEKNKCYKIIGTSKGIKNGLLPHRIVQQSLQGHSFDYVCVSGPGFAEGIIQKEITTVNVASKRRKVAILVYSP
jgi:glycerol-3-phosphate dehydrogenase (NAD(P)+)